MPGETQFHKYQSDLIHCAQTGYTVFDLIVAHWSSQITSQSSHCFPSPLCFSSHFHQMLNIFTPSTLQSQRIIVFFYIYILIINVQIVVQTHLSWLFPPSLPHRKVSYDYLHNVSFIPYFILTFQVLLLWLS